MSGLLEGPGGGLASSLVPSSESVEQTHPLQAPSIKVKGSSALCPKRLTVVVCDQDPTLRFPASCDAYGCDACGPRKALQAAAVAAWAIRRADRARFTTLTMAPEDWQRRRQKARDFRRSLARQGYAWEWGWTTERGSRTGMVHVHGLQHGSYVPQRAVEAAWGARVDIRAVTTGGIAQYVTKDALKVAGYTVKGATAAASGLRQHLDLNGGRAMHWSRGFLHGLDKRAAALEMRRELSPHASSQTWHLELATPGELHEGITR